MKRKETYERIEVYFQYIGSGYPETFDSDCTAEYFLDSGEFGRCDHGWLYRSGRTLSDFACWTDSVRSEFDSSALVLNVIFNAILIFGWLGIPKLGVVGAAIGTLLARGIEMVWCLVEAFGKNSVKIRWSSIAIRNKV